MPSVTIRLAGTLAALLNLGHDCYAKDAETGAPLSEAQSGSLQIAELHTASKNALDAKYHTELFSKYERGLSEHDGEIFDAIFIKSLSPIPSNCIPKKGIAPLYVLTKDEIALVRLRKSGSYSGFFDVRGLVLLDKNANGLPEAYGFGSERSSMGGDSGPQHSVRIQDSTDDLIRNFQNGLTVIPWHSPTLFIDMSDWTCGLVHHPNGDIARK